MIIIGHRFVKFNPFYLIKKSENIKKTPSNSVVVFEFNEENIELCEYCHKNSILFACICDSIKDVLFANALNASYLVCDKAIATKAQKLADNYMFDAKILLYSSDEADLEWVGENEIDGILLEEGINYEYGSD
jgi:hypothetical protein